MKQRKQPKKQPKNRPGKSARISLCMIVKNEEECLNRCLDSVKDYVDEMIIVDTGSTDRTVEIAESYGASVYHHPWENDFSKHRNQSLSYATGDWILQLDADEELFPEDGMLLRKIVTEGKADYVHCRFYDIKKDGSVHGVFYLVRLFRNNMGMGYVRKVHNQLVTKGRESYSNLRVRHYGYDLSPEKMEAKHQRTTSLLMQTLAEDPEDVYSIYQLSSSYSMHREFEKAVEYGEKALALMHRDGLKNAFFLTVFYTVAQGYKALGKVEEAERVCLEALDYFPLHLDICHVLASLYFQKHQGQKCREASERYLAIHDTLGKNPALMGGTYCQSFEKRNEIYFGLALISFIEGDFDSAEDFFLKSFREERRPKRALTICRFYLEQNHDERALSWLKRAVEASDGNAPSSAAIVGETAYTMAETFCDKEQWQLAQGALQLAVQIFPEGFDYGKFDRLLPKKN